METVEGMMEKVKLSGAEKKSIRVSVGNAGGSRSAEPQATGKGVGRSVGEHGWAGLGAREYMVPDPRYRLQRPRIKPLSVHLPLAKRKAKGVGGWSRGFSERI